MPTQLVFNDTFSDSTTVTLASRAAEVGGSWTPVEVSVGNGPDGSRVIGGTGFAYAAASSGGGGDRSGLVLTSDDWDVYFEVNRPNNFGGVVLSGGGSTTGVGAWSIVLSNFADTIRLFSDSLSFVNLGTERVNVGHVMPIGASTYQLQKRGPVLRMFHNNVQLGTDWTDPSPTVAPGVVSFRTQPSDNIAVSRVWATIEAPDFIITGPSGTPGSPSITHTVNELQNNAGNWTASGGTNWSLSGTDASLLNISSTGVVTLVSGNFDRETKSSYSFTVNRDGVSQSVTLNIANVNEAPVFSGTIAVPTLTVGVTMTPVDFSSFFSDVDIGDTASYTTVGTWPAGISIVTTSIAGTPSASGTFSNLRVRRTDSGGLSVDSNVFNIVVSAVSDTTPPTLTGSVTSSSVGSVGANISWPAGSDNVGVTGYEYRLNSGAYTSVGNVTSTSLSGLTPSTLYNVDVRAFDAAGNRSSAISGSFTTLSASDNTPPTLTGSITIGTITQNSIQISWPAGSDNVGVTAYEVSSNGGSSYSSVGNVTSFTFTGLTASTSYGLRVRARDAAGNVSAALSATQSTSAAPTPPPPPPPVGTKRIVVVLTTNGTLPAASLVNLKWAFFDQSTPDQFTAPVIKGATELTDASGVLEIDVSSSTLAIGQTGWLTITDSDGTIFQNPPARAFSAPVQVVA